MNRASRGDNKDFMNSLCCVSLNHSLQPKLGAYSVWKFADSSRNVDSGPTLNFSILQSWPRALTKAPGWRLVNLLDEAAIREQENISLANILPTGCLQQLGSRKGAVISLF